MELTKEQLDELAISKGFGGAHDAITYAETYKKSYSEYVSKYSSLFRRMSAILNLFKEDVVKTYTSKEVRFILLLNTKLIDMDISIRAENSLNRAHIETIADLVSFGKGEDLLKFRNFGKKTLVELKELLEDKGLHFGMNLSKYKI